MTSWKKLLQIVSCCALPCCLFVVLCWSSWSVASPPIRSTSQWRRLLAESGDRQSSKATIRDKHLAADYISLHDPPPGFEKWVHFAHKHSCHLGPYEGIDRDLQPFKAAGGITRDQIEAAKRLSHVHVYKVQNGTLHNPHGWSRSNRLEQYIRRNVQHLKDMEIIVNKMDEAMVLPGADDDVDARYASPQCQNASDDFQYSRHLHGSINTPAPNFNLTKALLPVFSQTKIVDCHADILFPELTGWSYTLPLDEEEQIPVWQDRSPTLYFRGSTTGGHYVSDDIDFHLSHRQRLVEFANGKANMDIKLHGVIQCSEAVCEEMKAYYSSGGMLKPTVPQPEFFNHKFLVAPDGNTFTSRLPYLMSGGGALFRYGLYSVWFDPWIQPGREYLRVALNLSDLESKLDWALTHDDKARLMGQRARHFARTRLRNEDIECYTFRLLLEYQALLQ